MPNVAKHRSRKVRKSSTEPVRVKSGLVVARYTLSAGAASQLFVKDAGDAFNNMLTGFREIKNLDASIIIYIGPDNTVTSATGYPIVAGGVFNLSGPGRLFVGDVWAIAASGTPVAATIAY